MKNGITDDDRRRLGTLADYLSCAYVAYHGGITLTTAFKKYGSEARGTPPGDYWIALAAHVIEHMLATLEVPVILDQIEKEKAGKRPAPTSPSKWPVATPKKKKKD